MSANFQALSDEQWALIVSLMKLQLPPEQGILRSDLRKVWNSLLFVLTCGCHWTAGISLRSCTKTWVQSLLWIILAAFRSK
ncbi:MAG: transposase [Simkania sp.]|nr:transposase [Simkania sp.]